jgi:uncharacterized membrane protein YbhN (UPF0104 family)
VGLIAGLTAAGIPQDQAVGAVFIERLCTACAPSLFCDFPALVCRTL